MTIGVPCNIARVSLTNWHVKRVTEGSRGDLRGGCVAGAAIPLASMHVGTILASQVKPGASGLVLCARLQPNNLISTPPLDRLAMERTPFDIGRSAGWKPRRESSLALLGHPVSASRNAGVLSGDRRVAEVYEPIHCVGSSKQMPGVGPGFLIRRAG